MLVTELGFEDRSVPQKRGVKRFQTWRYVGITQQRTCFLVDRGAEASCDDFWQRAQLFTSPAELLELLDRLGKADHHLYWLNFSDSDVPKCELSSVVALFRYKAREATWFSFMSNDGIIYMCDRDQPEPDTDDGAMVWAAW